jgi:hypothetical protein
VRTFGESISEFRDVYLDSLFMCGDVDTPDVFFSTHAAAIDETPFLVSSKTGFAPV